MKLIKGLLKLGLLALVAAAVVEELRKPRPARTGYGRVGGVVPYDFRLPTPSRLREALWNPEDDRVFTEVPFGVGWGVNFARLARTREANGYGLNDVKP